MAFSLKKHLISNIALILNPEDDEETNKTIILLTSYGLITGRLANTETKDNNVIYLNELCKSLSKEWLSSNGQADDNDGYLSLTNVTIHCNDKKTSMPFLNVFFDQIIGVSFGEIG